MVYNKEKKFIFIHIPKAAGTFMRRFLLTIPGSKRQNQDGDGHYTIEKVGHLVDGKLDEYYKFCIVRNPWDWYVSLYLHGRRRKAHEHRLFKPLNFKNFVHKVAFPKIKGEVVFEFKDDHTSTATLYKSMRNSKLDCGWFTHRYIYSGCPEWLRIFENCSLDVFIKQHDSWFIMDDVYKTEQVREDFKTRFLLDNKTKAEIDSAKNANVNTRRMPYREYYDEESRAWVAERERFLIERFGYSF